MQSVPARALRFLSFRLMVAVALCALSALQVASAQDSRKPLTEKEVINLLTSDVPPARVEGLARQFGISFQITSSTEQALRDAGATDHLIETLRQLAPRAARPGAPANPLAAAPSGTASAAPVLWIVSSPGNAHVYVDDEPVGTTSSEGRLKLSRLRPGDHRVRVARAGYQDFEQTVSLASGPATVTAILQQAGGNSLSSAGAPEVPSGGGTAAARGVLGMSVQPSPAGGQGVVVLALVPGGPAEQAGLRPGDAILSIAGRNVRINQDVQEATAARHPGEVVTVTFSRGSGASTVQVPLADISIFDTVPHFRVVHDHGPPAPNYCVGWLYVFDGLVRFEGKVGVNAAGSNGPKHTFDMPMSDIKEVKKNAFYLAALGAFHIRLKSDGVRNFVVVDEQGNYQPPNVILTSIETAIAKF